MGYPTPTYKNAMLAKFDGLGLEGGRCRPVEGWGGAGPGPPASRAIYPSQIFNHPRTNLHQSTMKLIPPSLVRRFYSLRYCLALALIPKRCRVFHVQLEEWLDSQDLSFWLKWVYTKPANDLLYSSDTPLLSSIKLKPTADFTGQVINFKVEH